MNKKSYLARVRLPRTPADWLEAMMNFIFFLCGMLAVGCVVLITVYMVLSGVPAIHKIGLFRFLLGTEWASTAADPKFGILPFILSSVYGTLGATLIGVPIGLLTAVFLSKAAGPKVRTVALSEYGGIAWPMPGHEPPRKTYGYGTARSRAELTERYRDLQRKTVLPQLKKGLSALVYTQLTDVEDEVNGLFTYDRTAIKPDANAVRSVNAALAAEFAKVIK